MDEKGGKKICPLAQMFKTENKSIPKLLELSAKAYLDEIGWPNSTSFKEIAKYEWHLSEETDLPPELVDHCLALAFGW